MPAKSTSSTQVRIQIDLPESVIDLYERQATSAKSAEALISERLQACAEHDAIRGLYLDDATRERVESVLGGVMLKDGAALAHRLANIYTVRIGGADIKLPDGVYQFLQSRAQESHLDLREMIHDICDRALADYVYGGT